MASIDAIEGMSHAEATRLRKCRVRTTEALLKTASTRSGRKELSTKTGIPDKRILQWVNRADLMRVKGIGSEYADLLEVAGVDTIRELRRRNPANLLETLVVLNTRKRLVRRLPTEGMVSGWIDEAKVVDPIVTY
jgi:predicted flap endonuclease-1-like 5' DNA nuclease